MKLKNRIFVFIKIISLTILINSLSLAEGTQTFSKELVGSSTRDLGEVLTYELKSACNSLTGDCGSLTITDTLPLGMVISSCLVPTGFTVNQCSAGSSDIEIVKDTNFEDGKTFILQIKALISLSADSTVDIRNEATSVIGSATTVTNETIISSSTTVDVKNRVPNWSVFKKRTSPSSSLPPTWDTDVSYELKFCSNSAIGNDSLNGIMMTDVFPQNVIVVNNGGGIFSNGDTLTWNLGDIDLATLYLGKSYTSSQCIKKSYVLKYPDAHFNEDDGILNTVTVTATTDEGGIGISESDTLNDIIGIPTPSANLGKSANDVLPNEDLNWGISANVNSSNAPVPNLVVYETFSTLVAGIEAKSISSGKWNSPNTTNGRSDVQVHIWSATDSANDCENATYSTDLSSGFIVSPSSSVTYPLNTNTTCVKWVFEDKGADGPAVPRGWKFSTAPRVIEDTTGYAGVFPIEVKNCVHATFTKFDSTTGRTSAKCGTANIEEKTPELTVLKSSDPNSLNPGDESQYTLRFKHDRVDSTGATINPIVEDLLPLIMDFVRWDSVIGLGVEAEPNLELIEDYQGTGRTLIRFSWADTAPVGSVKLDGTVGVDNPASFSETADVSIKFTVRVKAGTLVGSYSNTMQFFDNSLRNSCNGGGVVDIHDLDGDGDTTEMICEKASSLVVLEAAVLGGDKWIKGDENLSFIDTLNPSTLNNGLCPNYNGFTRYPCVAQTTRGGAFEYLFKVVNIGNEPLDNYIFYDVLPGLNDTGVGEPLATVSRDTRWNPYAISILTPTNQVAIDAMAQVGAVIEYSTASNPCLDEVSASGDETGWQGGGCTDDWGSVPIDLSTITAFRVKIPFSSTAWNPIDEMEFKLSMKAPINALVSDVTNSSKLFPAWNSFAHRITQASNGSRLPTAEPKRVGIVVPKGPSVSLGSIIWNDVDNNGIQDTGETLITDSTKFELFDSKGQVVTDNANNIVTPIVSTTGKYFFSNLPEGNYTVKVTPQSGYIPSSTQVDIDNNVANDSNIKIDYGDGSYSSSIIELTNDNEPIELSGLNATDDNDNSDNSNGDMSVDFGFYKAVSLGDTVWYDKNANGIHDTNETGVENIIVRLYDTQDTLISTTKTASNGKYLFSGLSPSSYYVQFEISSEYRISPQGKGVDNTKDSDGDLSGKTALVSLVGGATNLSLDLGIYQLPSLGDTVWDDDNKNGIQDFTEQGVVGVEVKLFKDCIGDVIARQVTDKNGKYVFEDLLPASYCVEFSNLPIGYEITEKEQGGNDTKDSDVNADGKTDTFALDDGVNNMSIDLGIFKDKLSNIGDTVWYDDNKNGVQDPTEFGVNGVKVTLYDNTGTVVDTTVTDAKGTYLFRDLNESTYTVLFTDLPSGYKITQKDMGVDDKDSDVDALGKILS
jgi:hypothetical protein